jgi:hypothetical protein
VLPLLLALIIPVIPGPAPDTTLVVPFDRAAGQQYQVDVEKVREEYATEAGRLVLTDRVRHRWLAGAEVRSKRPGGFSMAWTYRPEGTRQPGRTPQLEPVTGTLANVRIVFAASQSGRPLFVLNPLWVRSRLAEAVEAAGPRTDPPDRPRLEAVLRQAQSAEGLTALVLSDPERLYLVSGRALTLGDQVRTTASLPNPFGAGRIPAVETMRLDSLDADGRRAYVSWSLVPDPVVLANVVLDLLEGFAPGAVRLTPAELANRFRVSEQARFRIDLRGGWVEEASFERRVQAGERVRVEITTLRTRRGAGG